MTSHPGLRTILLATGLLLAAGAPATAEEPARPNLLFIMLDDYGVGQFAPMAAKLTPADLDPEFVRHVETNPQIQYPVDRALEAAAISMPVIDKLAGQGLVFTRAYAASALCSPSRAGLVTGCHPNRFGFYENTDVTHSDRLLEADDFLAWRLQAAGYATAQIGKWHIGPLDTTLAATVFEKIGLPADTNPGSVDKKSEAYRALEEAGYFGSITEPLNPLNTGFDYYYGYNYHESRFYDAWNVWENFRPAGLQKEYNTDTFTDKAAGFIRSALAARKPFFVSINYHAVHGPLLPSAPEHYMEHLADFPPLLRNFFGHVRAVDANVGKLIDLLRETDALDNTIIVFTSDNGAAASRESTLPANAPSRGHKGQYVSGGMRVPLLISWPAGLKKTGTTDALVSLLDTMPTFLDAAGVALSGGLDGKSLLPLLRGQEDRVHDHLVFMGLESSTWGFQRERSALPKFEAMRLQEPGSWAVITDRHLLRFTGTLPPGLYADHPDGLPARTELYDLPADPGEKNSLAESNPETVKELRAVMAAHAQHLPPPNRWNRKKWTELMESLPTP